MLEVVPVDCKSINTTFLDWICLKGMLDGYCRALRVACVVLVWIFKTGGTKACLKFVCILKGRARRREGWLQGRSENQRDDPHEQS